MSKDQVNWINSGVSFIYQFQQEGNWFSQAGITL